MPPRSKKQPSLSIRGVVRAQNQAYALVRDGIPSDQIESFRAHIKSIVQSVEQICEKYHTDPDQLPPRTFRAYQSLKSYLELELPQPPKTVVRKPGLIKTPQGHPLRLRGLMAFCQAIQDQFNLLIKQPGSHNQVFEQPWQVLDNIPLLPVFQEIHTAISNINQIAQKEKRQLTSLSARSLRAYQWLSFVSVPENLQAHLLALSQIDQINTSFSRSNNKLTQSKYPQLKVEFFHIPGLYRSQQHGPIVKLVAHEGFIFSPLPVLESLVNLAYHKQTAKSRATIRDFADSYVFIQSARALAALKVEHNVQSNGSYQDLLKIFNRVNARYFSNQLQPPRLSWSSTPTFRKYGHYQPSTDSLVLSASLDDASIPDYVLDFAMYHELLHKHLGVTVSKNRRIAHHTTFRKLEAQFPQYEQAMRYLDQMGRRIKKKKTKKTFSR